MLDFALTALLSLLFVVNPPGAVPTYLVMTQGDAPATRRRTAWRASLVTALTLALFAGAGNVLFHLFSLTMPAFQIAGGLLLFLVAVDMLRAERSTQEGVGEASEGAAKADVAITPLAVPMLAGPAALSTVTMLMNRAGSGLDVALIYLTIFLTGLTSYVTLRLAEPLYRGVGQTGIHLFSRVFGLILAAIAVQFVLDGLQAAELIRMRHPAT
jgi:multiple antibiotic resistance protein